MRRSPIAVCLLLLSPVPAWACDGHPVGAPGWLEEKPRSAWDLARGTAEEVRWQEMLGVASLAAGSGAMVLVAVSLRAASRAASRGRMPPLEPATPAPLAVPVDQPTGLPVRVDPGHERPEPSQITREDTGGQYPVAVAAAVR
jgi:hypothetical protein